MEVVKLIEVTAIIIHARDDIKLTKKSKRLFVKRHGNLYEEFISFENMKAAIISAVKGKETRKDVKDFIDNGKEKLAELNRILADGWVPSEYRITTIQDKGKVRTLSIAPFFPDRIIHHMINNILEKIYYPIFIRDTYQCIKGRGTHQAIAKTSEYMAPPENNWALKVDISKYYPSVDNEILKAKLKRKIKDTAFLELLDSLVDSHIGLPLGNHTSQLLGNIYLSELDHELKSISKYYLRYADDLVILGDKTTVITAFNAITEYCLCNKLKLNPSTQYFNLSKRNLEFLGFRFFKYGRNGVYVKPKKIKLIPRQLNPMQKASVYGWLKNSKSLMYLTKMFFVEINSPKKHFIHKYIRDKVIPKDKYHKLTLEA